MLDKIPSFLLKLVVAVASVWPWLADKINAIAINSTVNVCRHRPHPWSTVHDYTSWTSLTDQRWSARHLQAKRLSGLPKADAVTDDIVTLFKRPTGVQRLSTKSTCLFPSFAQYLTDGFIRTRMPNKSAGETDEIRKQNTSNNQIDLCPLYGRLSIQTDALRLKSPKPGERGRLKSQLINGEEYAPFLYQNGAPKLEFKDLDPPLGIDNVPGPLLTRLFAFGGDRANGTPQVAMMNTLFLREHNRLAGLMAAANPDWDDDRVFETARMTTIVLFIKVVVEEYINHISPFAPPFHFRAVPAVAWDASWNKPNWVTTEFSLLYRWHSLIPDTLAWSGTVYPVGETLMNNQLLLDAGLLRAFTDISAQAAGCLGALNTADALLQIELNSIMQGRICAVASYSDYREYVHLPRPQKFEDISTDPKVVNLLKAAYNNQIDNVEFYIGLFAEEAVKNSPLPPLILKMVAVDAFSQALTNPLLSKSVFNCNTFSPLGWAVIANTGSLRDILDRNTPEGVGKARIGMTLPNWRPS
ncbi:MAG TPA: peroxidase family protein [Candidatus Sulfotelmatobacter sp.]